MHSQEPLIIFFEKDNVDKLNGADSLIDQTEKTLEELGDKLAADKKEPLVSALEELKKAHASQDLNAIDTASAILNNALQAASQDIQNAYQAQPGAGAAQGGAQESKVDSEVTDVDFEEVK